MESLPSTHIATAEKEQDQVPIGSINLPESTIKSVDATKISESDPSYARELVGTQGWLNSNPIRLSELKGRVILLDFWTYSCVNCIRTFPVLKQWYSKYSKHGLLIIGVHTPEFQFEHDLDNLKQAISDHGINWPVVQDNNRSTWRAYKNLYWPTKYIIDHNGVIRYSHFGEGNYEETERWIHDLLIDAGANISHDLAPNSIRPESESKPTNDQVAKITSELYLGYERACDFLSNIFANSKIDDATYCQSQDMTVRYRDPKIHLEHRLYLQGDWFAGSDGLKHASETQNHEDYVLVRFFAANANAVLASESSSPIEVLITLDDEHLTNDNKGHDVTIKPTGESYIRVTHPRMYNILQEKTEGDYKLKLSTNSSDLVLYTFTFGTTNNGS